MIRFTQCKCSVEKGKFNINEIPQNCPAVWRLMSSGNTTGVFQLETNLGQEWSRKVKPDSIEELSALIALIRPGPLEANMSQDYVDIKFGRKKNSYLHPSLKPILDSTFGCLVYQEQAIRIATDIAGFSPEISDKLRSAIGKKKPELMATLKYKFIKGAKEHRGMTEDISGEIFGWIEKCQRYCIAGDTIIRRPNGGNFLKSRGYSVRHMYHIMNDIEYAKKNGHAVLRRKWKRLGNYGKGLSLCEDGRIRPNTIKDIQPAGEQQLYKLTLDNGAVICTTSQHKFPTLSGEKTLSQLKVGDTLYSCGTYEKSDCSKISKDSDKTNVDKQCQYKNDTGGFPTELVKIQSIELDKIDEVWDVTMDIPNHNFVIDNDIVTSNSFNLSHAISYGTIAYQTVWLKCHFPYEFFTSYLTYSQYKSDPKEEVYQLVQDARLFNVDISAPDIRRGNIHFEMIDEPNKSVAFGLAHIRGVGSAAIIKIVSASQDGTGTGSLDTWYDFLMSVPDFHRNVGVALIKAGACDCYNMTRSEMIRELEVLLGSSGCDDSGKKIAIKGLTTKEKTYFFNNLKKHTLTTHEILLSMSESPGEKIRTIKQMTKPELITTASVYLQQVYTAFNHIVDGDKQIMHSDSQNYTTWFEDICKRTKKQIGELILQNGYKDIIVKQACSSDSRRNILAKKASMLEEPIQDTNSAKAAAEKHFLGIALSCSKVDDADHMLATHTCLDIARALNNEHIVVCAIIDAAKHIQTKRGKNPGQAMCFLTISDSTYSIDHGVVFPDVFKKLKAFCQPDLVCLIYGDKKNGSFIIRDIQRLM